MLNAEIVGKHFKKSEQVIKSDVGAFGKSTDRVMDETVSMFEPKKRSPYQVDVDLARFWQALNNSSMNSQSTKWMKCDSTHFFIFNGLQPSKMAAHSCAAETLNKSEFPWHNHINGPCGGL